MQQYSNLLENTRRNRPMNVPDKHASVDPAELPQTLEVVEIDDRQRIYIPARLTEGLGWFDKSLSEVFALMKFDEPGRIFLLSWRESGSMVLAKREALVKALPNEEAKEALLILDSRYRKVRIERSGRLTLSAIALVHLFGPQKSEPKLFVVGRTSNLELWSAAFRQRKLLENSVLLNGLP
jgi:DNA-binding transcriptional regulator/RsmH inhibitor MraZ